VTATIAPEDLADRLARGEHLGIVDVRDRDEFEQWTVEGPGVEAVQVPHARFLQAQVRGGTADLVDDVPEPLVVVCGRGEASDHAADLLCETGLDARNLAGGMDAWARVYRATELPTPDGATVVQYHRPATGCLAYLVVGDGDAPDAAVVDPLRAFADGYAADAADRGATLSRAIDTHVHADHVSGVRAVAEAAGAEPAIAAGARDRGLAFDATPLADGEAFEVGDVRIEAIHAPGHTGEMTALLVARGDGPGTLLAGDSLFLDGVARPDLEAGVEPEDAAGVLYDTLRSLRERLPDGTLVAPGHVRLSTAPDADGAYAASLGSLFTDLELADLDREAFVDRVTATVPPPANAGAIVAANLGEREVEDPAALELGPNNCAAGG